MSEQWSKENLPENHELRENVKFAMVTEDTWKRKKNDGTEEVVPKWDFITEPIDGLSEKIQVYSATDKEEIKINTPYDLIVKKNVGKDGTVYGFGLKGFALHGQPIPRKEPLSRWQKGQTLNTKAEALKASAQYCASIHKELKPDEVIEIADVFESYIKGEYKTPEENAK
jgi:hypothetical protein